MRLQTTPLLTLIACFTLVAGCDNAGEPDGKGKKSAASVAIHSAAIVGGSLESNPTWDGVGALTSVLPGWGYQGSFCTGTLLSSTWVLTAAHCVVDEQGTQISTGTTFFYVGNDARPTNSGWPSTGNLYAVDLTIPHPTYDPVYLDNDIALVHLSEPVTNAPTYVANSSYIGDIASNGLAAFYVGFGATEGINSSGGGRKRSTSTPVSWVYEKVFISDYDGSGTCFGDSGGPAFLGFGSENRVVGVTSAGESCDADDPTCPDDPCQTTSISTRVDFYANWIATETNGAPPNCNNNSGMCGCSNACQADGTCDNTVCATLDCEGLYSCLSDCGQNSACQSGCYTAGTESAQTQLESMFQCFGSACSGLDGDAYQSCISTNCSTQIGSCFPTGSGPATCSEVYDCLVQCPASDDNCSFACYENGTTQAQQQFDAMQQCFNDQCADANGDDFADCANAQCGAEISTCIPPVYGNASCAEVDGCLSDCSTATCQNDCLETGHAEAQNQILTMYGCFDDRCGDVPAADYSSCAYAQCGDEIDACVPSAAGCAVTGGDCGNGQACYPAQNGTSCFPTQGLNQDASCQDGDSLACRDGLACWDGSCRPLCTADQHCGAGRHCEAPAFSSVASIGICSCYDGDQDGACAEVDCNDSLASSHPGAPEACNDQVDNDCDGSIDEGCSTCVDTDDDGYCDVDDCDDSDPKRSPGLAEVCGDGIDNDCDGVVDNGCGGCVDNDNDGYCQPNDCNDSDQNTHPSADEVCGDRVDNNCDGVVDNGCGGTTTGQPSGNSGGCQSGPSNGPAMPIVLGLGLLALIRRRRRAWPGQSKG